MFKITKKQRLNYNIVLFALNFVYIFIIGLFTGNDNLSAVYYVVMSLIYFFSILTVEKSGLKHHHYQIPVLMAILLWIGFIFKLPILIKISGIASTLFFLVIIVLMVIQIARSKKIGSLEFLEAVNIYLLFGIAASVLFKIIYVINPQSLTSSVEDFNSRADFIYFAFVTLTTLGYGDVLPVDPAARSVTIFFSVAGQLYLTMIIAMLVGKYLNSKN